MTWDGTERRRSPHHGEMAVTNDDLDEALAVHAIKERDEIMGDIKALIDALREEFLSGFPNGDLDGHCDYHTAKINAAKAEEEFWHAAKSEALKHGVAGLFAVLKWVLILAALGAAYKFGFGPLVAKALGVTP